MTTAYLQQLEELNRLLLKMASFSEEMVVKALNALREQNVNRAKAVILKDEEIDQMEIEIDQCIFSFLALQHPVASDLRFILAAQKINNDLERIADHAVNIAEASIALADAPHIKPLVNIPRMSEVAREMLQRAIDSFVYRDSGMAMAVKQRDDEMDDLHNRVQDILDDIIRMHPENFYRAAHLLSVSTNLERIADHATNIAEEVIFMTDAEMVKHREVPKPSMST
jgi:phosphate transport system protein